MLGADNAAPSSLRANGSRECAPDDRLREAIHAAFDPRVDCCVALLLANDRYKPVITRRINCGRLVDDFVKKPLDFLCKS
jgi:hypothetical protein